MSETPFGQSTGPTQTTPEEQPEQLAPELTETAAERQKTLEETRRDQQIAAGKDPEAAPEPLGGSGNEGIAAPTVIGDQEFDLPADTSTALKSLAGRTVSTDSQGIDRVVSQHVPDWSPAPVDPDPAEVARLKTATEALEAHRAERRALLGLRDTASREQAEAVSS